MKSWSADGVKRWRRLGLWLPLALAVVTCSRVAAQQGDRCRVYVDGLPLAETGGVQYTGVDVTIGADGVVHIATHPGSKRVDVTSPGSRVSSEAARNGDRAMAPGVVEGVADPRLVDPAAGASALAGRYWLVVQDRDGVPSGWGVEVEFNGRGAGTFVSGDPKVIEVTSMLHRGENVAELTFVPPPERGAAVGAGVFQVILAPGKVAAGADTITLGYPVISQDRTGEAGKTEEILHFVLPPPVLP